MLLLVSPAYARRSRRTSRTRMTVGPGNQLTMTVQCRKAEPDDFPALEQMLEFYQYELSDIWSQELDSHGRYGYDLSRHKQDERFHAHIAMEGNQTIGFALVAPAIVTRREGSWMEQFFIHKRNRRSGAGTVLARHVFCSHPGLWEVGQMTANLGAQGFWRKVIADVTCGDFLELQVTEGWWLGVVQQFDIQATAAHLVEASSTTNKNPVVDQAGQDDRRRDHGTGRATV